MLAPAPRVMTETIVGQGVTEVRIRRRDRWLRLFGLVALTLGWLVGGLFALALLAAHTGEGPSMMVTWLVLWTVLGLVWLYILLWGALGTETLLARVEGLTLMRRLLFIRHPVVIPAETISAIEWLADDPARRVLVNGRRVPQTALGIVCAGRVVTCARGIDETEAGKAIAALKQRLGAPRRPR